MNVEVEMWINSDQQKEHVEFTPCSRSLNITNETKIYSPDMWNRKQ